MKKPDITPGQWHISRYSKFAVQSHNRHVASIQFSDTTSPDNCESENTANAKAISAVPEMIDALIEAHRVVDHYVSNKDYRPLIQIKEALKKAGCEL